MESTFEQALAQQKQLHFVRAQALYLSIENPDDKTRLQLALVEAGLYHWKKARSQLEELVHSTNPRIARMASLRLFHLLVQCGKLLDASRLHESLLNDPFLQDEAEFWLYSTLYYWESGQSEPAFLCAKQALELARDDQGKVISEVWVLLGDLASAKGDRKEAVEAYQNALKEMDAYPANWRWLRAALIWNSLADVCEQFDEYDQADAAYQQAEQAIARCVDEEIFDLDGYRMEILLSRANFYALSDQSAPAAAVLKEARRRLAGIPMPTHLYWKSRTDYIDGLRMLYEEKPDSKPFALLYPAWMEQEQFVQRAPVSSSEYLGKAAYYAAYCYDPSLHPAISQQALYEQALAIFRASSWKDPRFFCFSIASIENELGNIAAHENRRAQALEWYRASQKDYQSYLRLYPDDLPARLSSCAVLLNELGQMDEQQLGAQASRLLDLLSSHVAALSADEDQQAAVFEIIDRLADDPRLEKLAPQKVEALVRSYGTSAA